MPSIPMILANLGKPTFFTTLVLKSGYPQIYLAEWDREKTSFSINGGKYEFCRLPFGLKNAGSIFQRAIDDVLREQIGKCCYVYVDDVIIFYAKRPNLSERMTGQRSQRINNVEQAAGEEQDYEGAAIEQDIDPLDSDDLLKRKVPLTVH